MIERILRYFFPKITFHWTVWDHGKQWEADLIRHVNGEPCLPPEARHAVTCSSKGTAINMKDSLNRLDKALPGLRKFRDVGNYDLFA